MNKPLTARNRKIVLKRKENPKKWSYQKLGDYFGLNRFTIRGIVRRDFDKFE
jgi:DNA-binding CsgD family transcriptional regulator